LLDAIPLPGVVKDKAYCRGRGVSCDSDVIDCRFASTTGPRHFHPFRAIYRQMPWLRFGIVWCSKQRFPGCPMTGQIDLAAEIISVARSWWYDSHENHGKVMHGAKIYSEGKMDLTGVRIGMHASLWA